MIFSLKFEFVSCNKRNSSENPYQSFLKFTSSFMHVPLSSNKESFPCLVDIREGENHNNNCHVIPLIYNTISFSPRAWRWSHLKRGISKNPTLHSFIFVITTTEIITQCYATRLSSPDACWSWPWPRGRNNNESKTA